MPTLYVEHVPEDLYEALRTRARSNRRSIAAETISLLENVLPSAEDLRRREGFYRRIQRLRSRKRTPASGPAAEDLLREDRLR
jgi:plasmid stability protein